MTDATQDLWNQRIAILNSVGVPMPDRTEIAQLDIAPDRLRAVVRAAYGRGLRGVKIVAEIRVVLADHDPTMATPGPPDGELRTARDSIKPNEPETTERNGKPELENTMIAATPGTTSAVDGKASP